MVSKAQVKLCQSVLNPLYRHGVSKIMLTAEQMRSFPEFFADIPEPRSRQGTTPLLQVVLSIAVDEILCEMHPYEVING